MSRSAFKMKVITNGGLYQSGVSKKTSYLVCNDRESGTTKVKKAFSLGVKVIDENEFITLLEGGNDFSIF
jgi:DNA ligase (NAD+)